MAEIVGGQLRTHRRPGPAHARASSKLGGHLDRFFDEGDGGPGGFWILDQPELHLAADIVVPDLAGWRVERMPELPTAAFFELAPDWICEVLSPSTAAEDRADKMPIYAEAGVAHAWLLDPVLRTLEVFALEKDRWILYSAHRDDGPVRAPPFDAVELSLGNLWSPPRTA